MDAKAILQHIIDNNGSCNKLSNKHCKKCPLSKLKRRSDGTYYSCLESVCINNLERVDSRYKHAAEQLLLTISIDELLKE